MLELSTGIYMQVSQWVAHGCTLICMSMVCAQIIHGLNFRSYCGPGAICKYFNLRILGEDVA